jgi:hypothetical protein
MCVQVSNSCKEHKWNQDSWLVRSDVASSDAERTSKELVPLMEPSSKEADKRSLQAGSQKVKTASLQSMQRMHTDDVFLILLRA